MPTGNTVQNGLEATGLINPSSGVNTTNPLKWGADTFGAFIDRMKEAQNWNSSNGTSFHKLNLDENGWPKSLPVSGGKAGTISTKTMWYSSEADNAKNYEGKYYMIVEGTGTIDIVHGGGGGFAMRNVKINGKTILEFDYNVNNQPLDITIKATDTNNNGDYIRNIKIVHEDHMQEFEAGEIFTPEYIDLVQDFRSIRYMQWMEGNRILDYAEDSFAERDGLDYYSYNLGTAGDVDRNGIPIDIIVALANKTGTDAWINIPINSSDEFALGMARYIEQNLDPRLKVYVELGNEMWNGIFDTNTYAQTQAKKLWGDMPQYNGKTAWAEFSAMRSTQIGKIFQNVFENNDPANADARLINVMGASSNDPASTDVLLTGKLWKLSDPSGYINPASVMDSLAVGGYFGGTLGGVDVDLMTHMAKTYGNVKAAELIAHYLSASLESKNYIDLPENVFNSNGTVNANRVIENVKYSKDLTIDVYDAIAKNNNALFQKIKNGSWVENPKAETLFGSDVHNYVRLEKEGGNSVLKMRFNTGNAFRTVLEFDGIVNKSINELIADGTLIVRALHKDLETDMQARFIQQGNKAENYNLDLLMYEGGQHISQAQWGKYRNAKVDGAFKPFLNYLYDSPAMESIYESWFDAWIKNGGGEIHHHKDYQGRFGSLKYVGEQNEANANTSRFDFIEDLNQETPWVNENRDAGTFLQGVHREGNNSNNVLQGTVEEDVLIGNGGNDILRGGDGNDALHGGNGADQLYGNAGNDIMVVDANDTIIDGGSGHDTIRLAYQNSDELDFAIGGAVVSGVETIDLRNLANNKLLLNSALRISDNGETLMVQGEKGDSVSLANSTFQNNRTIDGVTYGFYKSKVAGGQDVLIEKGINVSLVSGPIPTESKNVAPNAQNDSFNAIEGNILKGENVLGNDTDSNGDNLEVIAGTITTEMGGKVILSKNGDFTYTPKANFVGNDFFGYSVIDGRGESDTATVQLKVSAALTDTDEDNTPITPEAKPVDPIYALRNGVKIDGMADAKGINLGDSLGKTQAIAFETGANVNKQQVIYEQGGATRGFNLFIEDGKLFAAAWNKAETNWNYKELDVNISANTKYTATFILDGTNNEKGTASLYLNGQKVDTVGGIGKLYEHAGDIGIGQIAGDTLINNQTVRGSTDFTGKIEKLAHFNAALKGEELGKFNDSLAKDWLPEEKSDETVPPEAPYIMEFGSVNANHNEVTVSLKNHFNNPVVFATMTSHNGEEMAVARITDIQNDSFTLYAQEADYLDQSHTTETFSYIVVEKGSWTLDDGTRLEVGTIDSPLLTSGGWNNINFDTHFNYTPAIFSQVQTNNGAAFVTTRHDDARNDGFNLAMQEEEASNGGMHLSETIGYFAIEQGAGSANGHDFFAKHTGQRFDHNWEDIVFNDQFDSLPQLLAQISTTNGTDTSVARIDNLQKNGVDVMIQEDRSHDNEVVHTNEVMDIFAIEGAGLLTGTDTSSII